jgi:nucleotide-binding universal stress UspA family protein
MYRSILVPLDGSPFSEHALPLALTMARRAQARVHLMQVHISPVPPLYAQVQAYETMIEPELKKRENAYLRAVEERVKQAGVTAVTSALPAGPVIETIEKEVVAQQADLVVMTTHGRGPLSRFWLGSVADQLVRQSTAPVLLVRPSEGPADLHKEVVPPKVLIPLDGSPLAEQILPAALAMGSLMKAECALLRIVAWTGPLGTSQDYANLPIEAKRWLEKLRDIHEQEMQQARDYLDQVAGKHQGIPLTTRVISAEQPASAIVAEAGNAGIIALATHGRHGLPRLFLGSVADKVIRSAHGPVLVYRPRSQ